MAGLFGKAMKDANFSVTTTSGGTRSFDTDKDDSNTNNRRGGYRGRSRGRSRGRGRGGGNWRGGRGGYRGRGRNQSQEAGPRSYLDDDDDSMEGGDDGGKSYNSRYNPYGSRPPSRRGFRNDDRGNGPASDVKSRLGYNQAQSSSDWYKVSIVNGKQQDKDWLIKRIQNSCEEAFQPSNFHYVGDTALFFVEGKTTADAIKKVSHQITIKNGSKLIIAVRPSGPPINRGGTGGSGAAGSRPNFTTDPKIEEALKKCLSNRYDVESKAMNLSSLIHDEVLKENDIPGHIYKPHIAGGILKLIGENCQDMEGLDLSDNRIYNLDSLKDIANYAPSIKHLKLSNNQLKSIEILDKLKGLHEIVTLDLSGNPLCDKYEAGATSYITAVRSRFPKVITLDGTAHAPPIGFDVVSTTSLPKVQESYMGDPAIKQIIVEFLQQYFKVYDSGNRQPLLEAYHDQAMFSLSVNTGQSKERPNTGFGKDKGQRGASLGEYMKISRNMLGRKEPDQRASLLKSNRLSVVALLNELPATSHDLPTFLVDVQLALPSCLSFSIQGFFMEANKTPRSFTRVFVAVPAATGKSLQIVNDELHVRSPSLAQIQSYQKQRSSTSTTSLPSTVSPPSLTPSTSLTSSPGASNLTPEQQQMVSQFSHDSKMNSEWSYKCLSENAWNYQKAAEVFTALNSKGSIPANAFTKS